MNTDGPGTVPDNGGAEVEGLSASDWVTGNRDASVVVIEYGDFQCPACGAYHPILKQLKSEFGDRVAFVYRHFPLRSIHQNAEASARATEAAGKQGKFWEMHDVLFERQTEWGNQLGAIGLINGYAEELGLDMERYEADLKSDEIADLVNEDLQSAIRNGLSSTPTFVLDGKVIQTPRSVGEFQTLLNTALNPEQ
ncbi:MAG: hypothetical protein A2826_00485 [Candidatus Doudnabacteria bacterium RIFCSPHIGHO2_01_FULL_43_23]|uniref:Thioredoxin domain-containing protein n=1 Tax=Candidatus Doudnabacteria bacterium RIFCSPHIGHO2_01_FULL_43_23 TaxID=1817822 RepID=A0A1F5NVF2_9BACT|nr:MAG: hypothetical protein A2826_00485 [Candidatus Doudnabacteria bacterium RIFCSPHIGHO2_01_FULL_43_23]